MAPSSDAFENKASVFASEDAAYDVGTHHRRLDVPPERNKNRSTLQTTGSPESVTFGLEFRAKLPRGPEISTQPTIHGPCSSGITRADHPEYRQVICVCTVSSEKTSPFSAEWGSGFLSLSRSAGDCCWIDADFGRRSGVSGTPPGRNLRCVHCLRVRRSCCFSAPCGQRSDSRTSHP